VYVGGACIHDTYDYTVAERLHPFEVVDVVLTNLHVYKMIHFWSIFIAGSYRKTI